jgi:hypothetical protein
MEDSAGCRIICQMHGEKSANALFKAIGIAIVFFLAGRALVLPAAQPTSDVFIYAQYTREADEAARQGLPFYAVHARAIDEQAAKARVAGVLRGSLEEYRNVEYPPLALSVMRCIGCFVPRGQDESAVQFDQRYLTAFRFSMAVIDVLLFTMVVLLARQFFPEDGPGPFRQRLLVYLLATMTLWHLLYDRLDLLLALLVVCSLELLTRRVHYLASFVVLAVAVNFKLVPVVLAPVWALAAQPTGFGDLARGRNLAQIAIRAALLLLLIGVIFLPYFKTGGEPALAFLTYHQARGLEVGSILSTVPLVLQAFGQELIVVYSYGSINLVSPVASVLARLAPPLAAGCLGGATLLLFLHVRRLAATGTEAAGRPRTLGQLHPTTFAAYTLLFLMLFIGTNKVFSPQYLLWLAPLVVLLPLQPRRRTLFFVGFVVVCALSTILVPFLYITDLVDLSSPPTVPRTVFPPTVRVSVVIIARNALFVALTAGLVIHLWRAARGMNR